MTISDSQHVHGVTVPTFFYGTAWKEERTAELTRLALEAGFRAIDTANQRRHYVEAGVGEAVATALAEGKLTRQSLFLQTKFTYARGQDHRLPYDPDADPATQVAQSFASSLQHLRTNYVDGYVLHGPAGALGITATDRAVWAAMEALHDDGKARLLGVSNVSLVQLTALVAGADVKPAFVQNRCFAATGWDREVRAFCRDQDIVYQGFSLLTANARELSSAPIARIARGLRATVPQLVFQFALQVGMIPLTGTTNAAHMREDLGCYELPPLDDDDLRTIESIGE